MTARTLLPAVAAEPVTVGHGAASRDRVPSPVPGGELPALATSLRARGLDVLRRSRDRAPPPP
jgi:hypothetical protein